MARYDPQRSRARRRVTDDEAAPVDALLGPSPTAGPAASTGSWPRTPADSPDDGSDRASNGPEATGRGANGRRPGPRVVDLDVPAPADLPDSRSRVTAFRLALIAAVLAAVAALVVWLRRRRSTADE